MNKQMPALTWLVEKTVKEIESDQQYVARETFTINGKKVSPFYVKIGFAYGVEFHFLPTREDWKNKLAEWFHVKHASVPGFQGAYIH